MDLPVAFNFHKELEKILRVYKKEKIYACSDCPEFHFAISCFRNYEVSYNYCGMYVLLCVYLCMCVC